jgi:hypothetical protein
MTAIGSGTPKQLQPRRTIDGKWALTVLSVALLAACASAPGPAAAVGSLGSLDVVSRGDSQVLPVYPKDGRFWVVGTPGREYSVRVCNSTAGRMLAVMSVDGVNVITGDTAAPGQSGYVLGPYECADIAGWRKSMSRTAAFYFTELPDAYAARTGRPENVGVIGVAFFPEKQYPVPAANTYSPYGRMQPEKRADAGAGQPPAPATAPSGSARHESAAGGAAEQQAPSADAARERDSATAMAQAPLSKLGTGDGRNEHSPITMVQFERASSTPAETVAIHYDRRENLVAMGVLPPPVVAHVPNPFPAAPIRFVPNPPGR